MERQKSHSVPLRQNLSEPKDPLICLTGVSANTNAIFRDKGDLLDGFEWILKCMKFRLLSQSLLGIYGKLLTGD